MRYDVSFWQSPDWQRESSMNPTFLVFIGLVGLTLVVLAVVGGLKSKLQAVKTEMTRLEIKGDESAGAIAEIQRQKACIRRWSEALKSLENINRNRLLWSRQLESFALSIPEDMRLSVLTIRNVEVPLEPEEGSTAGKAATRYGTQYEMAFQGQVLGEQAGAIIRAFSRDIREAPGLGMYLERIRLSGETPLGDQEVAGKSFVLNGWYRPLDWQSQNGDDQ